MSHIFSFTIQAYTYGYIVRVNHDPHLHVCLAIKNDIDEGYKQRETGPIVTARLPQFILPRFSKVPICQPTCKGE